MSLILTKLSPQVKAYQSPQPLNRVSGQSIVNSPKNTYNTFINSHLLKLMKVIKKIKLQLELIKELFHFLWQQKLYWLIPTVTILILFGLFFIFAETSTIAHFIYPLI